MPLFESSCLVSHVRPRSVDRMMPCDPPATATSPNVTTDTSVFEERVSRIAQLTPPSFVVATVPFSPTATIDCLSHAEMSYRCLSRITLRHVDCHEAYRLGRVIANPPTPTIWSPPRSSTTIA